LRRVVVDPGVLVSAIITPDRPPAEILREIRRGRLAIVVSPHLLAELLGVLRREQFRRYMTRSSRFDYFAFFDRFGYTSSDFSLIDESQGGTR
jgi:putative PIN family toxin of toxin-antitoxin system